MKLAWLPVPLLLLVIVYLKATGEGASLEAPFLLLGINFVFFTLISLVIASVVGRSFIAQGRLWQLLLGCGVLVWGTLGSLSVAAGLTPRVPGDPFHVNMMVTTYNCGVFVSALCHLASALFLQRRDESVRSPRGWLAVAYPAALAVVSLIAYAAMVGLLPRFFVQGEGGTPLRQFVLGTSVAMFLVAALLMQQQERRCPTPFSRWYTVALVLIAVGLLGVSLQSVTGSLLNWTARLSQVLGSVYMLVAAIASARENGRWTLDLETALADAQQQFVELFQLAADGIAAHGVGDDGRWTPFTQVNDAFCGMLGYSREEMLQLTPYDVTVFGDNGHGKSSYRFFVDETVLHERVLVRKDGGLITAEISTRRFRQSGHEMVMSVVRDVSERKKTERELAENAEKLRLFFEHAPAAVAMFDREMRYIHCSRRWLDDYKLGSRDLTGISNYEVLSDLPEHWKEVNRRCLAGATERCEEEPFHRADGTVQWLRWEVLPWRDRDGEIGGIIVTSEDITDRKRAESELQKAHEELQKLLRERTSALDEQSRVLEAYFRHSPSPLMFLDRECNFIRVNDAYARACGREGSYFAGRNHFVEYPSHELQEKFMTVVRTGKPYSVCNRPFVYPDDPEGKVTYWDLYVHPILDGAGEVDFLVFSLTDVTERKLTEDVLREKDYLLLQQSRNAAMGEMINNIAHQWRQPLNSLGLSIQRLPLCYEMGGLSAEFLHQAVDDAMVLIQHMSQTIDDFRDFSRPDREKEEFQIAAAIDSAVKLVEASFQSRNICIVTQYVVDLFVCGYRNAFSQVMVNLLNNARDAFDERQTANPRVIIRVAAEGERSVVTVSDNGGGIPEEILYKIFEPHFTTKGPQGTGIGLFMAKNIIERNMHGRLGVRNCGDGAEFRIDL